MTKKLSKRQSKIVECWNRLDDDDISTERLLQMVEDDTGADVTEIIDAMVASGEFQPVEKQP